MHHNADMFFAMINIIKLRKDQTMFSRDVKHKLELNLFCLHASTTKIHTTNEELNCHLSIFTSGYFFEFLLLVCVAKLGKCRREIVDSRWYL